MRWRREQRSGREAVIGSLRSTAEPVLDQQRHLAHVRAPRDLRLHERDDLAHVLGARRAGIRFAEISIQYSSRLGEIKLNPWRDGFYNLFYGITVFPASLLFGFLWSQFGAPTAFVTSACISLIAAILLVSVRPSQPVRAD